MKKVDTRGTAETPGGQRLETESRGGANPPWCARRMRRRGVAASEMQYWRLAHTLGGHSGARPVRTAKQSGGSAREAMQSPTLPGQSEGEAQSRGKGDGGRPAWLEAGQIKKRRSSVAYCELELFAALFGVASAATTGTVIVLSSRVSMPLLAGRSISFAFARHDINCAGRKADPQTAGDVAENQADRTRRPHRPPYRWRPPCSRAFPGGPRPR